MRKERGTQQAGEGEESKKRRGSGVEGLNINSYPALPTGGCVRKKGITRCREAWECVAAAARPGRGCPAVSRAAAAGLSPGRRRCAFGRVSRDRQRRPLHSHPRARRPRGDLHWPVSVAGRPGLAPAPLQVALGAGGKSQEEGSCGCGTGRLCCEFEARHCEGWESRATDPAPPASWNWLRVG